jgi:hypothetical protein
MKHFLLLIFLFTTLTASAITRYFLVSYTYSNGTGTVGITSSVFPSKSAIVGILRTKYNNPTLTVVITNIMEFKTQADFATFFADKTYFDTVATQQSTSKAVRTWYFKDLSIRPNTGQCLTDRVQQVIDSAVALGGSTTLIMSESGTYNFTNAEQVSTKGASVVIDVGCYPGAESGVVGVAVDKCK